MPAADTFYRMLTAAVADLERHGYDREDRLASWLARLAEAARREMTPERQVEARLTAALKTIFARLVDHGGLLRQHAGVSKFTLANFKPSLRAELDRRIMASANLIRLNREEAIGKTLRRFSGWATSIPIGGSETVDRREVKTDVRRSLAQLNFVERRVAIDQGHKLTANLSDILAQDAGAIAARWQHHHVRYPRAEHLARHNLVFLIRGSWAHKGGLVKPGPAGYVDEVERPGELVFCRCTYEYLYNVSALPPGMITSKGQNALEKIGRKAA